jgi:hypothetical protein
MAAGVDLGDDAFAPRHRSIIHLSPPPRPGAEVFDEVATPVANHSWTELNVRRAVTPYAADFEPLHADVHQPSDLSRAKQLIRIAVPDENNEVVSEPVQMMTDSGSSSRFCLSGVEHRKPHSAPREAGGKRPLALERSLSEALPQ